MSDVETPTVTVDDTKSLVPTRLNGDSMLDRWINADPDAAMARLETMVTMLAKLRLAAIKATYPSDWIIHTSKDVDGQVIRQVAYLQDCGAERAGKIFGIEVSAPAIEREDFPDGTYTYNLIADAWSKVTGERLDYVEGARWSGDRFFTRNLGPEEKPDPTDIRKAAYANLHGRTVRALSGLSAVPLDMLQAAGVDVGKVVMIGYEKGGKGGESAGAAVGTTDVVIPWGNCKGQKAAEISDPDLKFYLGAVEKSVADPERARFRKSNERLLAGLKAEQERRSQAAAQETETGTAAPAAPAGEGSATPRGTKLGDMHVRLSGVAQNNARYVAGMIRAFTKRLGQERASLSALTDAELDQLIALKDEDLARLLSDATAAPKE